MPWRLRHSLWEAAIALPVALGLTDTGDWKKAKRISSFVDKRAEASLRRLSCAALMQPRGMAELAGNSGFLLPTLTQPGSSASPSQVFFFQRISNEQQKKEENRENIDEGVNILAQNEMHFSDGMRVKSHCFLLDLCGARFGVISLASCFRGHGMRTRTDYRWPATLASLAEFGMVLNTRYYGSSYFCVLHDKSKFI